MYCDCSVGSNHSIRHFVVSIVSVVGSIVAGGMADAMEFTNFPPRGRAIFGATEYLLRRGRDAPKSKLFCLVLLGFIWICLAERTNPRLPSIAGVSPPCRLSLFEERADAFD